MSKYKYTGLLSSQYRSVFKSYHSVDRYGGYIETKSSCSQNKRQGKLELRSGENNKSLMMTRENLKTISHDDHYRTAGSQAKTNHRIKFYTQSDDKHCFDTNQHYSTNIANEKLLSQIKKKYQFDSNDNVSRTSQLSTESKRTPEPKFTKKISYNTIAYDNNVKDFQNITLDDISCKRPYADFNTISYKNNSLKTKVSQVNKRRDDIKLKIRVNDIDQINRRYDYLDGLNNQPKVYNQNNQQNQPNKYYQRESLINPLQQASLNHLSLKLERRILENITNKRTQKLFTKNNEQQNIKTPHFHNDQTKTKEIDAAIIENKLKSFSKKTYADRY